MYHEREDGEEDEGMMGFGFSFGLFLSQMDASSLSFSHKSASLSFPENNFIYLLFFI